MTIIREKEYKSPRQISSSSSSAALGRRLSAEERHEEWEKYNDNQAKKKKRTTRQQQQHRKEEEEKKNTLWELRNCRPGPRTASRQSGARAGRKRSHWRRWWRRFLSLCPYKASHYTPSPVTHLLYSQQQRAAKKRNKKRRKRHGVFIYNGESSSRGSRESFVPRKPKGEGYLIQSNGHRFNEYFFFLSVKLWTLSEI